MESGRKRNPDLGNERRDDDEYVDYEEEQEEELKSTHSNDSQRTETGSHGRVKEYTQPDDRFAPINDNENDSQRESLPSSYQSDISSQRSVYDGEGFLSSYIPITAPNLDFGKARLGIDDKLVAFVKDKMFHNKKPEVDFSTNGFSILNKVFKTLEKTEQDSFFIVLDQLNESLTTALAACFTLQPSCQSL